MATPDRRAQVQLKIDRARSLREELTRGVDAFFENTLLGPGYMVDPQTKEGIYFAVEATPPNGLSLVAGDIIQNLRTALDHLAYQLVSRELGDPPPKANDIYFPVAEHQAGYDRIKRKKLPGVSDATLAAVDAVQPYDRILWTLHDLNNADKHRLLLTVASAAVGVNVTDVVVRDLEDRDLAERIKRTGRLVRPPVDSTFPLKERQELFRDRPGAPLMADMQFRFAVAFSEQGLPRISILDVLEQMTGRVQAVADALYPLLDAPPAP